MTFPKRAPRNTANMDDADRLGFLLEAMSGGSTAAIEAQEAQGQASFVNSTALPTRHLGDNVQTTLEAGGVTFGDIVDGDPLFRHVTLPDGWKKQATDHSMWSKLVDGKGRERASIFYKAAFYDRDAHMRTSTRYSVQYDYDHYDTTGGHDNGGESIARVYVGSEVIWSTGPNPWETRPEREYEYSRAASDVAVMWLDHNYPDWRDASAYWD